VQGRPSKKKQVAGAIEGTFVFTLKSSQRAMEKGSINAEAHQSGRVHPAILSVK
jgi:hypothetical protein